MRGYLCTAFICTVLSWVAVVDASPLPNYQPNYYNGDGEIYVLGPEEQLLLQELLARYGQDLIRNHEFDNTFSKRGLDLGLSRGYSGSVAAQHRLALFAANLAGRKRRQAS